MVEIVAEISASHCGSLKRCMDLISAAKVAGADSVKLQYWTKDTICLDQSYVIQSGPWARRRLFDLYAEAWTPAQWFPDIAEYCASIRIDWFSSVFDARALEYLESVGCPRYKIASFELIDLELISACARTCKPVVISTGMGSQNEISAAVRAARIAGCANLTLLKCTSAYPSSASDASLPDMQKLDAYRCGYGLSDHSMGYVLPVCATALGATMIEKHISMVDGNGLDDGFALSPDEFGEMVKAVRAAEQACRLSPFVEAEQSQRKLRRSLYVSKGVVAGELVNYDTVSTARPAAGLSPDWMPKIMGMQFRRDVPRGTPLSLEMLTA